MKKRAWGSFSKKKTQQFSKMCRKMKFLTGKWRSEKLPKTLRKAMSTSKEYQVLLLLLYFPFRNFYSKVHSIAASKSRSATTKSSSSGQRISLSSVVDFSSNSKSSRQKSLMINDMLADIVMTRRADEEKRKSTTQRMSVASQSRFY